MGRRRPCHPCPELRALPPSPICKHAGPCFAPKELCRRLRAPAPTFKPAGIQALISSSSRGAQTRFLPRHLLSCPSASTNKISPRAFFSSPSASTRGCGSEGGGSCGTCGCGGEHAWLRRQARTAASRLRARGENLLLASVLLQVDDVVRRRDFYRSWTAKHDDFLRARFCSQLRSGKAGLESKRFRQKLSQTGPVAVAL